MRVPLVYNDHTDYFPYQTSLQIWNFEKILKNYIDIPQNRSQTHHERLLCQLIYG